MGDVIVPPPETSDQPDIYTRKAVDFTSTPEVDNRCFHIDLSWFRYGTDDKNHSAALVLSGLLLILAVIVSFFGTIVHFSPTGDIKWVDTLVTWIGNAFLFTAGIALGTGGKSKSD